MKRTALLLAALSLSACQSPTAPSGPAGLYQLEAVDNEHLPMLLGLDARKGPWFVRGTIELRENGSYLEVVTDSLTLSGGVTGAAVEQGRWAMAAGHVTFTLPDVPDTDASYAGRVLVRLNHGRSYRYVRR